MIEPNDRLEGELTRMRPRGLAAELVGRIESDIAGVRPWSDRLLICAMGAGSLAACVIAVMLTMNGHISAPEIRPAQTIAQSPTIGNYALALARADDDWIGSAN